MPGTAGPISKRHRYGDRNLGLHLLGRLARCADGLVLYAHQGERQGTRSLLEGGETIRAVQEDAPRRRRELSDSS